MKGENEIEGKWEKKREGGRKNVEQENVAREKQSEKTGMVLVWWNSDLKPLYKLRVSCINSGTLKRREKRWLENGKGEKERGTRKKRGGLNERKRERER